MDVHFAPSSLEGKFVVKKRRERGGGGCKERKATLGINKFSQSVFFTKKIFYCRRSSLGGGFIFPAAAGKLLNRKRIFQIARNKCWQLFAIELGGGGLFGFLVTPICETNYPRHRWASACVFMYGDALLPPPPPLLLLATCAAGQR